MSAQRRLTLVKTHKEYLAAKSMTAKSDNLWIKVRTEHTGLTVQTYTFK